MKSFLNTLKVNAGAQKVALVFHLKIKDYKCYKNWLNESNQQFGDRRLYRVKADPVPREEMLIDEIVIDEYPSAQSALDFISAFDKTLEKACLDYAVLAIIPEPSYTFRFVKVLSWLIALFKGANDKGMPPEKWQATNSKVWPDDKQMAVARERNLDAPLFVYNLNKYKSIADYSGSGEKISGQAAYDRYAKIAGFELLRRGAYPVYGGKPISVYCCHNECMLNDEWHHFIFVRYPQRRNLLTIIERDEFNHGQVHRDAGLERVAIFMASEA